jgi:protein-tyrosine-phosphatase
VLIRRRRVELFAVLAATAMALVACDPDPSQDERAAEVLCEELRAHDDRIVDLVNTSVAAISERSEDERSRAISDGLDQVEAEVVVWRDHIDDIDLGAGQEVDELRRELRDGAERALDELASQRTTLRSGPIPDRDVQGAVGEWFNAVEKVMSVSEPSIFGFERHAFKQAFLDEPACRHVIQRFVND